MTLLAHPITELNGRIFSKGRIQRSVLFRRSQIPPVEPWQHPFPSLITNSDLLMTSAPSLPFIHTVIKTPI
jgi:hypothetical protein